MLEDSQRPQASRHSKHAAEGVKSENQTEVYKSNKADNQVSVCFSLTSECFFLEDKSRVVSYKLSTKFLRQGTFTSFFTAWDNITHGQVASQSYPK